MSDARLEELLRDALRTEADALPFTITTAELERRHPDALRTRELVVVAVADEQALAGLDS